MADIDTTEAEATETADQARPAPGRVRDKALVRLCEDINRLMGPDGDVVDLRAPRSLVAA